MILLPTEAPATFQRLTYEDRCQYGAPLVCELTLPAPQTPADREKLERWIALRGATYAADRHSEYLVFPGDGLHGPRIMLSAVMSSPRSMGEYLQPIQQKRRYDVQGKKALGHGFTWRPIRPWEHAAEIHGIIHSTTSRQGRPIATQFDQRPPNHDFADYIPSGTPEFADICVGVFAPDGSLAAYLLGKRVGDHVQYDEIMGHADHLRHDVMYLLHWGFLETCVASPKPPACLNYGAWYSGANHLSPEGGLNRWKRKVKFVPAYLVLASS